MIELIIIVYFVLCAGILWFFYRQSPRDWLLRFICVSLFPVIGWLFPIFWPERWRRRTPELNAEMFAEPIQPEVAYTDHYSKAEAHKDLNVLSVEEALLVNEHAERRRVMLDVLKQDAMTYMDVLQKAVSNEDSETSHYAVSIVMEVKRKLTLSMQELSVQYESNRDDANLLETYAIVIRDYMRSGFLDERTLRKYKYTYVSVLEDLIRVSPQTEFAYEEKVKTELELGSYTEAEQTSRIYLERFPEREEAYLLLIQVYYYMKSHQRLIETIDLLKKSPIRLSHDAITSVRFWSEGA